jgi:uncharacterized protein (TIGR02271 family)
MSYTPAKSKNSRMRDVPPSAPVVDWDRIVHKNVRASDNEPVGKIIALPDDRPTVIITSQGSHGEYEIPRSAVSGFNGAEVFLNIDKEQFESYKIERTEAHEALHSEIVEGVSAPRTPERPRDESTIPVVEERLKVTKQKRQREASIIKEPMTETATVDVPVTREKLVVERRPAAGNTSAKGIKPVKSSTKIKVPVSKEEVEVRKEPYVKEEVVIKKKPVTQTRTVSDTITKEKVDISDTEAS